MQLLLTLNDNESNWLKDITPENVSKQSVIRALLLRAKADSGLLEQVVRDARESTTIEADHARKPGEKKGLSPEDYRSAVTKAGTLSGAADILGVARSTVREQCVRHDIYVRSIGGIPK